MACALTWIFPIHGPRLDRLYQNQLEIFKGIEKEAVHKDDEVPKEHPAA